MGIKEIGKIYTIECDRCGEDFFLQNEDYSGICDKEELDNEIRNSDWEKIGKKYFCQDCWTWNDMGEIIKKK